MGDGVIGPDITVVQYHVEGEQRRGQGHVLTQSQHTEAMLVLVTGKKVNNAMSMPALVIVTFTGFILSGFFWYCLLLLLHKFLFCLYE